MIEMILWNRHEHLQPKNHTHLLSLKAVPSVNAVGYVLLLSLGNESEGMDDSIRVLLVGHAGKHRKEHGVGSLLVANSRSIEVHDAGGELAVDNIHRADVAVAAAEVVAEVTDSEN